MAAPPVVRVVPVLEEIVRVEAADRVREEEEVAVSEPAELMTMGANEPVAEQVNEEAVATIEEVSDDRVVGPADVDIVRPAVPATRLVEAAVELSEAAPPIACRVKLFEEEIAEIE